VAAIAEFLKKSKAGLDMQNKAGRYLLKIESKKADWLNENYPHGGDRKSNIKVLKENLDLMPVPKKESSKAKQSTSQKNIHFH
jgi:hypothetical protein